LRGGVVEPSPVTGLAKLQVDPAEGGVKRVVTVALDQSVLRVTETPRRYL